MKALVAGVAGFLGSHLAEKLIQRGDRVVGVDSGLTGNAQNIAPLLGEPRFTFFSCDVSEALPLINNLDVLYHFASPASPRDYARHPLETLRVNGRGTDLCCAMAQRCGARLLFASTSEVYGDPLVHPQPESYWGNVNPNGPRSCYDEGKRYGEAVVAAYRASSALDARVVRLFNAYGPRMRPNDGRVIPAFMESAVTGAAFSIFGDGRQTRSLAYVEDVIDAVVRYSDLPNPSEPVINVGSDEEVTVLELAALVAEVSGVPLRVEFHPAMPDDPQRRRPSLDRAAAVLGNLPRTPLKDGLEKTLAWWRSLKNGSVQRFDAALELR